MPGRNILVTGGAGFIGSHLCEFLIARGDRVVALDNFDTFYEPQRKRENVNQLLSNPQFTLVEGDIRDEIELKSVFQKGPFDCVVHLAGKAGVRPSLEQAAFYMDVNVNGTQRIIDRILAQPENHKCKLVFGSSSSVYGNRSGESFVETDRVDQPLSPYAASKAAGELLAYAAHHTRGLCAISLRFFTVFGPRQRPDLAIHKFAKRIIAGQPIDVYGDGTTKRDYTFVSDIVQGIELAIEADFPQFEIFNLGRGKPVLLSEMIANLESCLERKATINRLPMQTGDMPYTFASIEKAKRLLGYEPKVSFEDGVSNFVSWFLESEAETSKIQ